MRQASNPLLLGLIQEQIWDYLAGILVLFHSNFLPSWNPIPRCLLDQIVAHLVQLVPEVGRILAREAEEFLLPIDLEGQKEVRVQANQRKVLLEGPVVPRVGLTAELVVLA